MKKRGSILIWTMFMSLFIVSFFIALQSGFLNFLNSSEKLANKVQNNIEINSLVDSLKTNPQEEISTGGYIISTPNINFFGYSGSLNFNEATEYIITSTGGESVLNLQALSGGPIEYNVISYDIATNASIYDSGVINEPDSSTIKLDINKKFNIIAIRNLGGYGEYVLQKSTTDLTPPDITYTISKDYGTWQSPIRTEKIINFKKKSSGINYDKFSIFLNSSNYE